MHEIALYYPHTRFRDETWLKAAALYWPKIARLAPPDDRTRDSETARKLSEKLNFIVNVSPSPYTEPVGGEFLEFIKRNRGALQGRYSAPLLPPGEPMPPYNRNPGLGWINTGKMDLGLEKELISSGLGRQAVSGLIVVAPALADVYTAALAQRVAASNDLAVVTDRQGAHGILNGWNIEKLAAALLNDDDEDEPTIGADDVGALYTAIAVRAVVPAKLDRVPVDRIIFTRSMLAHEFDAFRSHLNLLAERFAELGKIKDPSVLEARLELMVERDLRRPTQALEASLRQLGLEPAQAVLGLKSLELPAAAAAAASAAGLPPGVSQAGLVAARFIASSAQSRAQRQQMLRNSPAGYLLGLEKHLTPGGILERLRRNFRKAGKSIRPSTG